MQKLFFYELSTSPTSSYLRTLLCPRVVFLTNSLNVNKHTLLQMYFFLRKWHLGIGRMPALKKSTFHGNSECGCSDIISGARFAQLVSIFSAAWRWRVECLDLVGIYHISLDLYARKINLLSDSRNPLVLGIKYRILMWLGFSAKSLDFYMDLNCIF